MNSCLNKSIKREFFDKLQPLKKARCPQDNSKLFCYYLRQLAEKHCPDALRVRRISGKYSESCFHDTVCKLSRVVQSTEDCELDEQSYSVTPRATQAAADKKVFAQLFSKSWFKKLVMRRLRRRLRIRVRRWCRGREKYRTHIAARKRALWRCWQRRR